MLTKVLGLFLLLVAVLTKALLTFVCGNLVPLTFLSARHSGKFFVVYKLDS